MRQNIRGYTDGVIERISSASRGVSLGTVAGELAAVRDLLAVQDDLRRALLDPGVPAASRNALVHDLLSSRVNSATLRLLSFVIRSDRAPETIANIGWLATRLDAAERGLRPIGDGVLGHKAAEERMDGYATALLEDVTSAEGLGEIEDELFRFYRIVSGSDELRTVLASRDLPASARRQIVLDLLSGKASQTTTSLAAYATQIGRPRDYEEVLAFLVDRLASESDRRLAQVRAAVELDSSQEQHLTSALSRIVGHDVEIRVEVDASILAGFVATIGDTVVDGSARHRLDLLKDRLVMPEATITTGDAS